MNYKKNYRILLIKTIIFIIILLIYIKLDNIKLDVNNDIINNSFNNISKLDNIKLNVKNDIINNSFNNISNIHLLNNKNEDDYKYYERDKKAFDIFSKLIDKPINLNDPLIEKEKKCMFNNISNKVGKNITSIDTIYLNSRLKFGNQLLMMNKLIFYSELLGIKRIIIDPYNNLYIKNNILDEKYNLTIEINNNNQNYYDNKIGIYFNDLYYDIFNFKLENRLDVIKNEILKNLPKFDINPNDLYIHIRSGDIFNRELIVTYYAQFPLCFYIKVIETTNFKNIYIISENKQNPLVDELLKRYPNITFKQNKLEEDISYLAYAYNIIGSVSSFLIEIIKFNDNLKIYYEYDIISFYFKYLFLHHSLYNFPRKYTIFKMKPSKIYKNKMFVWKGTDEQINLMLNDQCSNKFIKISPNI